MFEDDENFKKIYTESDIKILQDLVELLESKKEMDLYLKQEDELIEELINSNSLAKVKGYFEKLLSILEKFNINNK